MVESCSIQPIDSLPLDPALSTPRLRDQHQALTRRAILEAARGLFAERGWAATSVKEIARRGGTAVQTIYDVFGSKAGVAIALADLIDEESGVHDVAIEVGRTDDPAAMLRLMARLRRQIRERSGDLVRLIRAAGAVEPAMAESWREGQRRRQAGIARAVARLAAMGALKEGLTQQRAADVLAALVVDEVCDVLVEQRGWSFDEYEAWLGDALVEALLAPG